MNASERQARLAGADEIICLTDVEGRWQRLRVSRLMEDPPKTDIVAKYDRDIRRHEFVPSSPVIIDWLQKWNRPYIQTTSIDSQFVSFTTSGNVENYVRALPDENAPVEKTEEEIIDPKYFFQTNFPEPPNTKPATINKPVEEETQPRRQISYCIYWNI